MKDLDETLSWAVTLAVALCLVFLFSGDPDLWDLLHAKAMAAAKS